MKDDAYLTKDVCSSQIRGFRKSEQNYLLIQGLLETAPQKSLQETGRCVSLAILQLLKIEA